MSTTLGQLRKGQTGTILSVDTADARDTRLLEMGFLEGSKIEVMHEAPWGKDPIIVRIRGALIALRRQEADAVKVELWAGVSA
jgi:ferrous iron transport protein A